jgi:hypothetical protein
MLALSIRGIVFTSMSQLTVHASRTVLEVFDAFCRSTHVAVSLLQEGMWVKHEG